MCPAALAETGVAGARHRIRIARGSFYLARELCEQYLSGIEAVAPLRRDGCVYLLPLASASAGGLLLKLRNAHGDRVLHAQEFLRTLGIDADSPERVVAVRWVAEFGGLLLEELDGAWVSAAAGESAN